MLTTDTFGEYLRVAGYPDGSDWWVLVGDRHELGYGVVGAEHAWYGDRDARLHLLHAPTRRRIATLPLDGFTAWSARSAPVTPSRDGRRLYVVQTSAPVTGGEDRVHVIDVAAGTVAAVRGGLPPLRRNHPLERADGRLLLPTLRESLVLLDPVTGAWEESRVPGAPGASHFWSGSPDGRWWVRFDPAALPVRDDVPGLLARLLDERQKPVRRYGLTLQIWEAFPLRFVRRAVAAWLTDEEMPNETDLVRMRPRPAALPSRRALWDAVAAARGNGDPLGGAPPRSAYPPDVAGDDAAWQVVETNLALIAAGNWTRVIGWQPDGAAFWVSTDGFLSCVGVDGTVSPRLYTQRRGLEPATIRPIAAHFREVVPLPGRKARVVYATGEALFDGAPNGAPGAPVAIPADRDGWRERRDDDVRAAWKKVEALREERRRVVVPLAGWAETDCAAAIEALAAEVRAGLQRHAVGGEVHVVFATDAGEVDEARFFAEVVARFPGAAPALRRLVDALVEHGERIDYLFSDGERGVGILGHAVKALGVLDASALPTIRRYGAHVDVEHERFFTDETVPAVIAAHGWTDDVVDFVFWVLARNFYNSLQGYGRVWREWGLRDAVVRREPRALARHVAADLAATLHKHEDARYGTYGLDRLAQEIPWPHEPWAAAFFDELGRVFAEPANA